MWPKNSEYDRFCNGLEMIIALNTLALEAIRTTEMGGEKCIQLFS